MAQILEFKLPKVKRSRPPAGTECQVILFTGVRVEYDESPEKISLDRRVKTGSGSIAQ